MTKLEIDPTNILPISLEDLYEEQRREIEQHLKATQEALLAGCFIKTRQGVVGSQLETNKKAMSIQCKVCMQTFMCTTSEVKCREHTEAKHPKTDVYQCFPHLKK
uniref:At2g23090-like zinc-binding domain-containing protein n=1 Tax=Oryza meridionalis TaxID=40149 RepID=A0A0E0D2L0_9ORYZ